MKRRKLFSKGNRRSLFSMSSDSTERRKLFSGENEINREFSELRKSMVRRSLFSSLVDEPNGEGGASMGHPGPHHYTCLDCGHTFEMEDHGKVRCPNCGGDRVVCSEESDCGPYCNCNEPEEESRDFSDTYDATDDLLKEFSEKTVSVEKLERIFSERGISESVDSMVDAGYATYTDDGQVCFSERPDVQRKLFSKIAISVTKVLELDPVDSKEALIHKLSENGNLPGRSIVLIKKAHDIPEEKSDYLSDSGILGDLSLQHGGSKMPLSGFQGILREQYNDAPDDILDKLVSSGIIDITGNCVEIKRL